MSEDKKTVEVIIRINRRKDDKASKGFAHLCEDGTVESEGLVPAESFVCSYVFRLLSKFIHRGAMPIDTTEQKQS